MKTKTPNRQNKINLNKFVFLSGKKLNKHKLNPSKNLDKKIFDDIELKQKLIHENNRKIKKIKIDSIKQLVYANRNIPKNWKSKPDYPNQVFELFSKDSNFLKYLGTGDSTSGTKAISKSTYNLTSNNYFKKNNNILTEDSNRDSNFKKKKLKLSFIKENNKIHNLKKYRYTTPSKNKYDSGKEKILNDKEILNILDELQMNYPIKEKLYELFPKEDIDKIQIKNEKLKNKTNKNLKVRYPLINSLKTRNKLKNNIYANLISSNRNEQNKEQIKDEESSKRYLNDYDIDILKKRKEIIKNPLANRHLERINYFGPYYSYCPSCGIKNLHFYEKLPVNRIIKLTNIIKKYKIKKYD